MTKVPPGPPEGGNRTGTSAPAELPANTHERRGAKVLRLPFPPDAPTTDAAKRVVSVFGAAAALEVASIIVLFASMTLAAKLPPLLARAVFDAVRRLRDAAALADLFASNRAEYDLREAEYVAAPSAEAVVQLAARPTSCATCGDAFGERWSRCPSCGLCAIGCCTCDASNDPEARP